jgi:hypothetical protein
MRRYVVAVMTAVLVGTMLSPAPGFARSEKTDVCHRSTDDETRTPEWWLLSVGGKAAAAHAAHGDGVPGGPVPGMPGYTFDASCVPERTVSWMPMCLDGAFESFDLNVITLDGARGADLLSSTDGTCSGDLRGRLTVVAGATDRSEARAACANLLGSSPGYYAPLHLGSLFLNAPPDWWACP